MRAALLLVALLVAAPVWSVELSYSVASLMGRPGLEAARGLELRSTFGGDRGDRWSVWLGAVRSRVVSTGHLCHDPSGGGGCFEIPRLPEFSYIAVNRRFYLRPHDNLKLYAGTGISYRDLTTCLTPLTSWGTPQVLLDHGERKQCVPGDLSVSSRWAFSQELGLVWRRVLDFSFGHFSTGGISEWNRGDNFVRFGFVSTIKRRGATDGR